MHLESVTRGLTKRTVVADLRDAFSATAHNSAYVHRRLGRRLGLRGAAARRSATWPFALVGLRATSHTCDTLCAIASWPLLE
jgi:hypothetical protein